jgi:hypothetical protein
MSLLLPPWSLHWNSDGELSPMDRADLAHLFLALHRPGTGSPTRGAFPTGTLQQRAARATAEDLLFPNR